MALLEFATIISLKGISISTKNMRMFITNYMLCSNRYCSTFSNFSSLKIPFIRVLGIEASCDDSAVAVIDSKGKIYSDERYSQDSLHSKYGGVFPNLACKLHRDHLPKLINTSLFNSGLKIHDIDVVAYTKGPGLAPCLKECAKAAYDIVTNANSNIMRIKKLTLVGVHHMEAHGLALRLFKTINYPFLTLLVSGGHCILSIFTKPSGNLQHLDKTTYSNEHDHIYRLGDKLDNSPGIAFDKVSVALGLRQETELRRLVGGLAVEIMAREGKEGIYKDIDILDSIQSCDFSFGGLLTSVKSKIALEVKQGTLLSYQDKANISLWFQNNAINHILKNTHRALLFCKKYFPEIKLLILSGGVAQNKILREKVYSLCNYYDWQTEYPSLDMCSDNGLMIAWTGLEYFLDNRGIECMNNYPKYIPKWPLGINLRSTVVQCKISIPKQPTI